MTATELRLKLVHLRMRFLNRGAASASDEKKILTEIESLSRKLGDTGAKSRAADPADRRFARRIQVDVPCRYLVSTERSAPERAAWEKARGAELLNVSHGGILIAAPERLDVGAALWIQPLDATGGKAHRRPFAAKTTVVRALQDGRRYLVGLVWIGAGDDEIERLAESLHVPIERTGGAVHVGEIVPDDRRRHLRHPVSYPIRFIIVGLPPLDRRPAQARAPVIGAKSGITRNLSRGGLLLATDVPVMEGSTLSLEVTTRGASHPPIRAKGLAVRVTESHGRSHVGIRFTDPEEVDEEKFLAAASAGRG